MVSFPFHTNYTGSIILNKFQLTSCRVGESKEQAIDIIQTGRDDSVDQCSSGITSQKWANM